MLQTPKAMHNSLYVAVYIRYLGVATTSQCAIGVLAGLLASAVKSSRNNQRTTNSLFYKSVHTHDLLHTYLQFISASVGHSLMSCVTAAPSFNNLPFNTLNLTQLNPIHLVLSKSIQSPIKQKPHACLYRHHPTNYAANFKKDFQSNLAGQEYQGNINFSEHQLNLLPCSNTARRAKPAFCYV